MEENMGLNTCMNFMRVMHLQSEMLNSIYSSTAKKQFSYLWLTT